MRTVPRGMEIFWGGRRFIEGEVIPPYVKVNLPDEKPEPDPKPKPEKPAE